MNSLRHVTMIKINQVINDIFKGLKFEHDPITCECKLICNKNHYYKNLFPVSVSVHDSFLLGLGGDELDSLYILSTPNIASPDKHMSFKSIASEAIDGKTITILNITYPMVKSEEEYFQQSLLQDMGIEYEDIEIINELKQYIKEALNL